MTETAAELFFALLCPNEGERKHAEARWRVAGVACSHFSVRVLLQVQPSDGEQFFCPHCGRPMPRYDSKMRRWKHLDTCGWPTFIKAAVPRVSCEEHGVVMIDVPWARPRSSFTRKVEARARRGAGRGSIAEVARWLPMSRDQVERLVNSGSRGRRKRAE